MPLHPGRRWGSGCAGMALLAALWVAALPTAEARPKGKASALEQRVRGQDLLNSKQYAQAIEVLTDAYERLKKELGPEHPETLDALRFLSLAYMKRNASMADIDQAIQGIERIRDAHYRQLVPIAGQYIAATQQAAALQAFIGLPIEFESELRKILSLQKIIYGKDSDEVIGTLHALAEAHRDSGDLQGAESELRRAWSFIEAKSKTPGSAKTLAERRDEWAGNALYRQVLSTLAVTIYLQGRPKEAETVLQRILQATERSTRFALDSATALDTLGAIRRADGDIAGAQELWRRALALWQGPSLSTSSYATLVQAVFHLELNQWSEAEALYRKDLAELDRTRGLGATQSATSLQHLSVALYKQGRLDEAVEMLERSFLLSEARLRAQRYTLSEARLSAHLQGLQDYEESYIYTLLRKHPQHAALRQLAMTTALLRKERIVDELASTTRRPAFLNDSELTDADIKQFGELRRLRSLYAALMDSRSNQGGLEASKERLTALSGQMDALARQMTARSAQFRGRQTPAPGEILGRVAASLPADGVLIEYVAYVPREWDSGHFTGKERYLALGLLPDGKVEVWDLGLAAEIDALAGSLIDVLSSADSGETEHEQPAAELGRRVWEPLRGFLSGRRTVFIAPDGKLAVVPFGVLRDRGELLLDRHLLSYLTTGRDLVPRGTDYRPHTDAVMVAAPDYQSHPGVALYPSPWEGARSGCGFQALPHAREEGTLICQRLQGAQVLCGKHATEFSLLNLRAPGVLHIATHGVFSANKRVSTLTLPGQQPMPVSNPLLRSALVMAGADWHCGDPGRELALRGSADGLASAMEISNMDLWGTQLVVLSACKSGLGEIRRGQGVLGLRRAIMVAGAETLVMSLWPVADEATKRLMDDYYQQLLLGVGRAQALQTASKNLRKSRPHFWAPFISLGQSAPLQWRSPASSPGPAPSCACPLP